MADKTSQLKIEAIYDTRGAEKVQKINEDLRKGYTELGRIIKDLGKGLQDLESMQKRRVDTTAKETEQIRQQIEQMKRLRQETMLMERAGQGGFVRATSTGARNVSVGGGSIYGGGTGTISGTGAPYQGPVSPSSGQAWANRLNKFGAIAGFIGAGVGMIGGAVGAVGNYMQHSGHAEVHEKTMALENLARAQSYRNHMFMESRQSPIGFAAYKAAANFDLKSRESGKVTIDEMGNIVQPKDAITRRETGASLAGGVQNMTGEMREQQGKIVSGYGQAIGAVGKGISGAGLIAGGIAGAATGAAIGSVIPGIGTAIGGTAGGIIGAVTASGGVGAIIGAIKEGTAAMFSIHHEEKKLREGEMEARQSELSVSADKMKDEILAITRYQMGVLTGAAGSMSSANRSSLGFEGYARGQTDFDVGESYGIATGAIRNFGRAGRRGLSTIYDAARRGVSSGVATEVVGAFGANGGNGGQQLERLMQLAVKHGMESIDIGFFEKLAAATAKGHYNAASGVVGSGAAAMMFNGMYRPNQYQVQERIGGIATGDKLFTQNSYFRSRGMVDAASILGNDANGARVAALADASMAELIGGSDRLRAGNISDKQREAFRSRRVNNLGDVLGGYGDVKKLVGDRSFDEYLRDLGGRLGGKDKDARSAAQKELDTLGFYSSALTGEQFGDLRGMLGAYGARRIDMAGLDKGAPAAWKGLGGTGALITSTQNRMRNQDIRGGSAALGDFATASSNMENGAFLEHVRTNRKDLFEKWQSGDETARKRMAAAINSEYNIFQGNKAAGTGPGYDSTQKLNEALGNTAKYLENEVAKALQGFVKKMDEAASQANNIKNILERQYMKGG